MIGRTNQRIAEIDGLRGISILLVLIGHLLAWRFAEHFPLPLVQAGIFLSQLGVFVFFTISGFVITKLSLVESEEIRFSARNFYLRRAIRILPAFLFYLIFIAVFSGLGLISQSQEGIAKAVIFSCNFFEDCGWFVGHSWTLAYEWQFYLLFPILMLFGKMQFKLLLILLALFTVLGISVDFLPDDAKSIAFIAVGCLMASFSKPLSFINEFSIFKQLRRIARSGFLRFFGAISYSLYLWQQLFTATPGSYQLFTLLKFPFIALLIAIFSYYFWEKAVGTWLRRKLIAPK